MSEFWFIFNPKSGTTNHRIGPLLHDWIANAAGQHHEVSYKIIPTQYAGHARELAREAVQKGIDVVVAIGGDGTVNEVASALVHSQTALGIVAAGSGNGLARHLGLSMNVQTAIQAIFLKSPRLIDTATLNHICFVCTAGIGFDAQVAANFAQQKKRGLQTYIKTTLKAFGSYRPQTYRINGESQTLLAMTFANAAQFGNNARIAPMATTEDGLLNLCTIKPLSAWQAVVLAWRLFRGTLKASKSMDYQIFKTIRIEAPEDILIHFDGEPLQLSTNQVVVEVLPRSLWVCA